ncbi:MAG: hypothetical protein JW768_10100 [Chitinispirillaceae bacterium]|nr:hypothetical protein [Chitinispirillaceae bacterium]
MMSLKRARGCCSLNVHPLLCGLPVLVLMLVCAPAERFSVLRLYAKERFSGTELSGGSITLTPLITSQGMVTNDQFSPKLLIREIGKKRGDLKLRGPGGFHDRYRRKYGNEGLDSLYGLFFDSRMVSLQTDRRIWEEVGTGYLMVLKLTYGLKTKTLDQQTVRQMRLEGELWDCDSMETVWRTIVEVRSRRWISSDKQVVLKAVGKLFYGLPPVLPGYGKGTW